MQALAKTKSNIWLFAQSVFFVSCFAISSSLHAELEELDDETLHEQTGKEGITLDLEFKLSIGEIYIDYHGDGARDEKPYKGLTPVPPRIEYGHINKQ
ncbi:MAG: DUF6160 family protein [Oleiphilus sp.]